jgi:hypothetical protein
MRLPLRHAPSTVDAPQRRCAHLEALVEAAMGLPLGPAATALSSGRSRGRHGNALQWHLGLDAHDGDAHLDWEDRIEIKLVSVWRRGQGADARVACDKLKVCDVGVDPWHKLANVMWVFADRLTRVVVGAAQTTLTGASRERLATAWDQDPHFDHPVLFVEAREHAGRSAPAYYLSARWFELEGLLPAPMPSIHGFDASWWSAARARHGRDPWLTLVDGSCERVACPRCGGPLAFDPAAVLRDGFAPARHEMPAGAPCLGRAHIAVDISTISGCDAFDDLTVGEGIEGRTPPDQVARLTDRVPEPDDHMH